MPNGKVIKLSDTASVERVDHMIIISKRSRTEQEAMVILTPLEAKALGIHLSN